MNEPKQQDATHSQAASSTPKRAIWKWVLGLGLLLGIAAVFIFAPPKERVVAGPGGGRGFGGPGGGGPGGGRGFGGRGGVTPVSTAIAVKGDLKIYLAALGTVNALNTAAVKTNASGELLKIYFTEGQLVKAGDILAEIDSRQYKISLAQAEGQLARDTGTARPLSP